MDPNAALVELRRALHDLHADRSNEALLERAIELFEGLDGWLSCGGFLPRDWKPAR